MHAWIIRKKLAFKFYSNLFHKYVFEFGFSIYLDVPHYHFEMQEFPLVFSTKSMQEFTDLVHNLLQLKQCE